MAIIEYRLRLSQAAKRSRVAVTPSDVEVVVPEGECELVIAVLLHARRRWIDERREAMLECNVPSPIPENLASGAKVL